MSQEILEKTNEISESIVDYVKDFGRQVKSTYRSLPQAQKDIFFPEVEGLKKTPGALSRILYTAGVDLGQQAIQRGAGIGAALGAGGGAALGAGIASGGVPRALLGALGGFRAAKKGGIPGKIGNAAFMLGRTLVGSAARAGIGAGLGGVGGGIAGFRGGRETGAKIAGAAALGTPAALAGPFAAGVGALAGGALSSDIASAVERARKQLAAGGRSGIFRS
jgi:hypothetical protein